MIVSVTIPLGIGRVRAEAPPGFRLEGRDGNGNGRPDVLERAGRYGTVTRVTTGSRIPRRVVILSH